MKKKTLSLLLPLPALVVGAACSSSKSTGNHASATGAGATTASVASVTGATTGSGAGGDAGAGSSGSAGGATGAGGSSVDGGATPAIFTVTDSATLALATALSGQVPFTVHLSGLEDVPQPCTWTPLDAGAPCNVEDEACAPTSATPTAESDAIWTCLRQRDAAYDSSMSAKYLGGGDLIETHFDWDFGDPSGAFNTVGGFNAAHTYDMPGTYSVSLTVRTGSGVTGKVTVPVTVTASTRPVVSIANDTDLAKLFTAPATGTPGRQIQLQRGTTYTLTGVNDAIQLTSGDWLTAVGDPTAPAPILATSYPACGSSCYIKLFATNGLNHIIVEDLEVQVASNSTRPFLAEPDGVDVVFRNIVTSDGATFTGPSRAFTLEGRGQLIQNVGAPRNADGSWASSGLSANFAFMTGLNISLYGNHAFVQSSDNNAEPGVRSCGPGVAFLSIVGNDIGGWFGKASSVSVRSGQNVYFGQDNVMWGTFDLQTGCSPDTFQYSTHDVVIEDSYLQNDLFQVNPGVFNMSFRNNVIHRQNINGSQYPLPVTVSVELLGNTDPWPTDRMELVDNTFLFEATVGKLFWLEGGQAVTRVDLVNNLFYAPGVGAALDIQRPTQVANPWDFLSAVSGNVFFLGSSESVASLTNGSAGSSVSLAQWNQISLPSGTPTDVSFAESAAGLPVLGSTAVSNVIDPVESCRPAASSTYSASGANLFTPGSSGTFDARGADHDLTGDARPAAGEGGWTPGALQSN